MLYVKLSKTNEVEGLCIKAVFDNLLTEEKTKWKQVVNDNYPKDEYVFGKTGILKYNESENLIYYEYMDRELTTEEKLQLLQEENKNLTETLDVLMTEIIPSLQGGE